ncbi:MAG: FAD-binding and (Fe-S)-binding domain-containing protein, partial [Chlamydiales bacterium]
FEVMPLGIVIPQTKKELARAVEIAHQFHLPVTVRGAATGITGGCLGRGLIIDTSKYLNRILHIDLDKQEALCEPGVIQDELNRQLSPSGYRLGPDTSTGNRATLGGMLANNAAGARSLHFGRMVDQIVSTELILASGELLHFQAVSDEEWQQKCSLNDSEGRIYRAIKNIKARYREEIEMRFPKIPRRVSGYNLDELLKNEPLNVSKLIAGSEGTLGIASEIKVKIVPKIAYSALGLLFFRDKIKAFQHLPAILVYHPVAVEMIDDQILQLGRASPSMRNRLNWLKEENPQSIFIIEFAGETPEEAQRKAQEFLSDMAAQHIGYAQQAMMHSGQMADVWDLRKAGLGILLSKRTYSRAIAFLEDLTVAPDQLVSFMERFWAYLQSKGKTAGIYGHVGSGCMHIRPYINLQKPEEMALMRQMMLDLSSLVLEYGGALSGEHGDGLIRSWLNPKLFGEKLILAFKELKEAFDPDGLMNPGKIVPLTDQFEETRTQPEETLHSPPLFLDFEREGGFNLAVDLCNGNGLCRKKEKTMCPSFQATNEEFHSTRARAQALRTIIHGRLPMKDFTSPRMHDVMDLCLSCKGCKTECPSQVDMAKMKAEFLYHYQEQHGYDWRGYFFAHIGTIQKWLAPLHLPVNFLAQQSWLRKGLEWTGIAEKRPLPQLAAQRFSSWLATHPQPAGLKKSVVLLNDTFTEFNHPWIGQAAVQLLNALGYHVLSYPWSCCGRPALSKGFLKAARQQAETLMNKLIGFAEQGLTIVGLEPSCLLTVKDDYESLIGQPEIKSKADLLAAQCQTLDEFLSTLLREDAFQLPFSGISRELLVHGHCHQKALVGMQPTLDVLRAVPGFCVTEIPSGCCGMAGSFGYEKEHYELSMKIGELCLLPAVRNSPAESLIVANGFSCRQQILDGTQRPALHLAEALWQQIKLY